MRFAAFMCFALSVMLLSSCSRHENRDWVRTDNVASHHHHHGDDSHHHHDDKVRFYTSRVGAELLLPSEEEGFVFGVFGDRTGGPAEGVAILADAVRDINLFDPDLVMTVGDLVQGYNTTSGWMTQMEEFKGIMNDLICPWFPVAGNHDVYWRGPNAPAGEHEMNYEMHFGPLWYAFEHKNSWFITLYSDEGNPETGQKAFNQPDAQRMSPEQFAWLAEMLLKARNADHVFLFLHHPRWIGGGYGDDWDRVHRLLVDAGNVTAVFAGHIHRMRSDPRDGIEYFALATTGGGQSGLVPRAGYLHHYNLVAVRKDRIAIVTVPVGEVIDPRAITGEVSSETAALTRADVSIREALQFEQDRSLDNLIAVSFTNPTDNEVELTLVPDSKDSRWVFSPDHAHLTAGANETVETRIGVRRRAGEIDDSFRLPMMTVSMDYIHGGLRIPIPERSVAMELNLASLNIEPSEEDLVLHLDGDGDVLRVASKDVAFPDGPMTLEAWFEADRFDERTTLIGKTQSSEYGFFISNGQPTFMIHLNGRYYQARGEAGSLETGRLTHIAGVFDGSEVRLYIDGGLIEATPASGRRTRNDLDLLIGGDVDGDNRAMSTVKGRIHSMALSKAAIYAGGTFDPPTTVRVTENTVFATDMNTRLFNWVLNNAGDGTYGILEGNARLAPK